MNIKKLTSLLLSLMLVFSLCAVSVHAQGTNTLEFGSDGKFTILQLTDPQDDQNTAYEWAKFVELALKTAQPDMVVFTGDIVENSRICDPGKDADGLHEGVTVEDDYDATLANAKVAADAIFAPVEKAGIPFAVTQGNNDYSSGVKNEDWLKIYASYPHCITVDQSNDEAGKIDTYVEINKHSSSQAGYGLWLLDNGRSFTDGQAQWFNSVETGDVPSIVFEHIPVSDIGNLFEPCSIWDSGAIFESGKTYRLNKDIANGVCYTVYTPGQTSEQFTDWKAKNVKGAFFGHVHCDGYTGVWDGITLGLTYGCQFAKAGPYGLRTITLDENGSFETELYTYADSSVALQTDSPYPVYSTKAAGIIANIIALSKFVFSIIKAYLNF